jgi:hypothetical protein
MLNKSKVKVGDQLRCVESVGRLICGEVYEVTGIGASTVDVVGPGLSEIGGYFFSRFEPITEAAVEAKGPECGACEAPCDSLGPTGLCNQCHITEVLRAERRKRNGEKPYEHDSLLLTGKPAAKVDQYWEERTGPYGGHDLGHEEHVAALTAALPENEAARKRNIAALAKDLDRPAPVRFPHPGRNFELKGFKS